MENECLVFRFLFGQTELVGNWADSLVGCVPVIRPHDLPLLGNSEEMIRVRELIAKVARARLPVLVEGETGTGKELVANALHAMSGRRGRFVAFNVGAIPDTMFESMVFGHVRGAFTGATNDADGFLAEADHGTAFFDEIGTLGEIAQGKLLRALETGTYRPVGARHDRRSDFRIVAATNDLLMEQVNDRRFRADLAHRLSGCVIVLPPLRERPDDIELLAQYFAQQSGTRIVRFSPDALRMLRAYPWPGNVRELRMFVDRVLLIADHAIVSAGDVKELLVDTRRGASRVMESNARSVTESGTSRDAVEREELRLALRAAGNDTALVSQRLGIHRSTLYRRMKQLGVTATPGPRRRKRDSDIRADSRDCLANPADADTIEIRNVSIDNTLRDDP